MGGLAISRLPRKGSPRGTKPEVAQKRGHGLHHPYRGGGGAECLGV